MNFANENLPPGAGHPLGTDANGYDVARPADGRRARSRWRSASPPRSLATVVGMLWGAIAGYFGGVLDAVMMRIVDALLSIPTLFLALVVVAIVSPRPSRS